MSFCHFEKNAGVYDVTPIENLFLLEYLPTAPEGFLRVYLYVRMLCLHPEMGDSLEKVAHELGMDPEAVFNAMNYWERLGLVRRVSDRPPTYELLPVMRGIADRREDDEFYANRDFNARLQAIFGPDNLLHPQQYQMASEWVEILGFTREAVLFMVEDRVRRSRSRKPDAARIFKKLARKAEEWAQRGISTREQVERALEVDSRIEKCANRVMTELSMNRAPTMPELRLTAKWLDEWNIPEDQILAACEETTKAGKPTMAYLDSILRKRRAGEDEHFDALKEVLEELGAAGKPTPAQQTAYRRLLEEGFEPGTILYAAQQCARKNKHRFEDLEWILDRWGRDGVHTYDEAAAYVDEKNRAMEETRKLLEACGTDRRPQMEDIALYEKFRAAYSGDLILFAAECARGRQLPLRYMDKLLSEWARQGLTTLEEAKREHQAYALAAGQGQAPGARPVNPALDYIQRDPSETDYESLLADPEEELRRIRGGDEP